MLILWGIASSPLVTNMACISCLLAYDWWIAATSSVHNQAADDRAHMTVQGVAISVLGRVYFHRLHYDCAARCD